MNFMNSQSYQEKKELGELHHKNVMNELAYIRDTEKIKHQWNLERLRIETAERRKEFEREEYRRMNT